MKSVDITERIHFKFCKLLLKSKQSTLIILVYGELGRYPTEIQIKTRMITQWSKLMNGKGTKCS